MDFQKSKTSVFVCSIELSVFFVLKVVIHHNVFQFDFFNIDVEVVLFRLKNSNKSHSMLNIIPVSFSY